MESKNKIDKNDYVYMRKKLLTFGKERREKERRMKLLNIILVSKL